MEFRHRAFQDHSEPSHEAIQGMTPEASSRADQMIWDDLSSKLINLSSRSITVFTEQEIRKEGSGKRMIEAVDGGGRDSHHRFFVADGNEVIPEPNLPTGRDPLDAAVSGPGAHLRCWIDCFSVSHSRCIRTNPGEGL